MPLEVIGTYLDALNLPGLESHIGESLALPVKAGEIRGAIKGMAREKTPGPDGLPSDFYQIFVDILASQLERLYETSLEVRRLPPSIREALVVPLPKTQSVHPKVTDFRPLSMLNLDFKILSKALATRILPYMQHLIHKDQNGFIPTRSTFNNLIQRHVPR